MDLPIAGAEKVMAIYPGPGMVSFKTTIGICLIHPFNLRFNASGKGMPG
jgi:hypothetical protein